MPWLNHDGLIILHQRRRGAARFNFDRKKLEQKMVLDSNRSCFLLQPLALRRRFREATDTLVAAIRRFDFALYSPLLSNLFGLEIVADEGSGVDALFPPKPAGRPKKHDWMRSYWTGSRSVSVISSARP